jgi:hypothetical protein
MRDDLDGAFVIPGARIDLVNVKSGIRVNRLRVYNDAVRGNGWLMVVQPMAYRSWLFVGGEVDGNWRWENLVLPAGWVSFTVPSVAGRANLLYAAPVADAARVKLGVE